MNDKKEEDGLIALKHSDGKVTNASFGGETYKADKNGVIRVPKEAVTDLFDHGFSYAE